MTECPRNESFGSLALGASILFHGLLFLAIRFLVSGEATFGILSREKPVVSVDSPSLVIEFAPPAVIEPVPDVPHPVIAVSEPTPALTPVPPPLPQVEPMSSPEPILSEPPSPEPQAPQSEPASVITPPTLNSAPPAPTAPEPVEAVAEPVLVASAHPEPELATPALPAPASPRRAQNAPGSSQAAYLVEPRYRHAPTPAYPGAARRLGLEGRVLLEVQVSAAGSVNDATVRESSGHRILDQAALSAVKRWRFHPGSRGKLPVVSTAIVPVEFKLE